MTFANVTSFLALFVALSAGSYAAIKLPANSVGSKQLKNKAVTSKKVGNNAISAPKIKAHAVSGPKIAANAIDTTKVTDGSLTGGDINLSTLGKVPSAAAADTAGSASISRVKQVSAGGTASPGGSPAAATATCDPGLVALGGGASLADQNNEFVNDTYPSAANAWTAHVFAGTSGGTGFTVYVICGPAAATS
ncbi:MAG: hypothetical protein ACJ76Z_04635 [Thermoleophilaceae bacterium]